MNCILWRILTSAQHSFGQLKCLSCLHNVLVFVKVNDTHTHTGKLDKAIKQLTIVFAVFGGRTSHRGKLQNTTPLSAEQRTRRLTYMYYLINRILEATMSE